MRQKTLRKSSLQALLIQHNLLIQKQNNFNYHLKVIVLITPTKYEY